MISSRWDDLHACEQLKNEDNFAPALVAASRALVATMMPELASYGFNGITPAFASLMPC